MAKSRKKKISRIFFILTCACMAWPGLALATKSSCILPLLSHQGMESVFDRLSKQIESGFSELDQRTSWLSNPRGKSNKAVRELVGEISILSEDQRAELLKKFNNSSALFTQAEKSTELGKIFKFFLHDEQTWIMYVEDLARRGTYSNELTQALPPALETMPISLKQKIHGKLRELYPTADKTGMKALPAKRALDAVLRYTMPVEHFFPASTREGAAASQAYGAYLKALTEVFPEGGAAGGYGLEDVLTSCRIIRKQLQNPKLLENIRDPEMVLAGSFPNGRAKLSSSDLDVFLSDPRLEAIFKKTDAEIAAALATPSQSATPIGLHLHKAPENWEAWEMGQISPVQIKITTDEIELWIYPRFTTTTRDIALAGAQPPVPLRLRLE